MPVSKAQLSVKKTPLLETKAQTIVKTKLLRLKVETTLMTRKLRLAVVVLASEGHQEIVHLSTLMR